MWSIEQIKQFIEYSHQKNGKVDARDLVQRSNMQANDIEQILSAEGFMRSPTPPFFVKGVVTASANIVGMGTLTIGGTSSPLTAASPLAAPATTTTTKAKPEKPPVPQKIALDSVVLSEEKREEIRAAISQVENEKLIFETWGFANVLEKGKAVTLLFYGIPGTGKTLMAQAIAESMDMELKIYGAGEIQTSEPGGAERNIKKIFDEAKALLTGKQKKRVILFDECDSLLYDRNKVGVILGAQINALLSEIERHEGVVIFTTNRIGKLDAALERRISAKIEFPAPDKAAREAIWKRMIPEKAPIHKGVSYAKLSEHPLVGGNIKNAVLNAARMAAYKKSAEITMEHFLNAVGKELNSAKAFEDTDKSKFHTRHIGGGEDMEIEDDMKINIKKTINVDMKGKR